MKKDNNGRTHHDFKEVHHGGHGLKPKPDLHSREEGVKKYGNTTFADPAHGRFPIDTDKHIKAAESYARFASPKVKARIDAAARSHGIGNH